MNATKLLAPLSLALTLACGAAPEPAPSSGPSASAGPADRVDAVSGANGRASAGAALFAQSCASCHGAAGRGGAGPSLLGADHDVLVRAIVHGAGGMPSFSHLDDAALADLTAFVLELR